MCMLQVGMLVADLTKKVDEELGGNPSGPQAINNPWASTRTNFYEADSTFSALSKIYMAQATIAWHQQQLHGTSNIYMAIVAFVATY